MSLFEAIFLGLVQGLTEFLPVSSSGHLKIFETIFNANTNGLLFDVSVHLATLLAVVVVLRKDIIEILKRPFQKLTWLLILATIPAVIAGVFLNDIIDKIFQGGFLGIAFIITAILLWFADSRKNTKRSLEWINAKDAGAIGLTQAIAIIPGLSRSGSTIAAGLFMGLKREAAMKFSFLMSIPVILGSGVMEAKDLINGNQLASVNYGPIILGMAAAAISGYFAVKFMLDFFKKRSLRIFSVYTFLLGILVIADQLIFHIFFKTFGI